jgi:hypothetical protein
LIADRLELAGVLDADNPLAQAGIADGAELAAEYITFNELGLALEHLCYVIYEAKLPISARTYTIIQEAGTRLGIPPDTWRSIDQQ